MNKKLTINDDDIKKVVEIILAKFKEKEALINELNVFPVPDGDTGTNMLLTLKSVQQELLNADRLNLKNIADKVSYGALMGARGNSGVILSQILKGFFDIIIQNDDLNFNILKNALKSSMELAYSSVQNPTEGTMLTTIKDIFKTVDKINGESLTHLELLNIIIGETEKSVLRTTFLLPVLKEAGVVDAGSQGLLEILNGLKEAILDLMDKSPGDRINSGQKNEQTKKIIYESNESIHSDTEDIMTDKKETGKTEGPKTGRMGMIAEIKNIYCTELMIKGSGINLQRLREYIENLGDSALVVGNDMMIKIHIHTNYPQRVLNRALREGTLHDIQINNMVDQSMQAIPHEEGITEVEEKIQKEYGIIAIANGDGFVEIFKSLGADSVIKGGQSMNPSTYEIVKAINKLDCENIIILPNNKNIVLTANQAKKIAKKNITVIPTISIPQGISSALAFNPDLSLEENINNMNRSIKMIKTGEVTVAIRDANLYVGEIKKGAYIGLANGDVKVISEDLIDGVVDLARDMLEKNDEIITLYYGEGTNNEMNKAIKEKLSSYYPKLEIEFHNGGQPLYPYIFSIE